MTALAADRNTQCRDGELFSFPMAATTTIYAGSLVALDSSGNAEPASTATGKIIVGCAQETVVNAGTAAAKNITVREGCFKWVNGSSITKAHIGDTAYAVDDQTISNAASGKSAAGIIADIEADGVWVKTLVPIIPATTGLLAANNLSDVGTVATARASLGLDTGNSPTFAAVTATGAVTAASAAISGAAAVAGALTGLSKLDTKTSTYTVDPADGGMVILDATDNAVITLPDAAAGNKGLKVTVINAGADDAAKISISPHSSDRIYGTIAAVSFAGALDKDIINTKSGANKGDYATLVSDGATGWYVIGGVGVWASES